MTTDDQTLKTNLSIKLSQIQGYILGESGFVLLTTAYVSFILLHLKLGVTPDWSNGILERNHEALLHWSYTNNEQSRLLQFLIPEFFHQILEMDILSAYALQRWLFTTASLYAFYGYLRKWFDPIQSIGCVGLLTTAIPLTFLNDLQESCHLLLFTYILGLTFIREKQDIRLMICLWIGSFNNETTLVLIICYFFNQLESFSLSKISAPIKKTLLVGLPAVITTLIIRWMTRDRPHLGGAYHWVDHWDGVWSALKYPIWEWQDQRYLHFIYVFTPFWIFAHVRYQEKSFFLRRSSLCIPFFLAGHFFTGIISESRQMIPLAPILIPMALLTLKETKP